MSSFLRSSLLQRLRPIATPREMDHGSVVTVVESEVGDDFAEMLAEPVPRPDGTAVDWYSVATGDFVPLSSLDPDLQARHRIRVKTHLAKLQNRISALEAVDTPLARTRATALRIAASFPGSDHIYVERVAEGGAEPRLALVDWGFKSAESDEHGGGALTGLAYARRPAPPAAAPATAVPTSSVSTPIDRRTPLGAIPVSITRTGIGWLLPFLLALLTLLLILSIFWLLLTACALRLPFGNSYFGLGHTNSCLASTQPPGIVSPGEQGGLQAQLLQLEEEFHRRQQTCTGMDQINRAEVNAVEPDKRFDQRLSEENSGNIQLTLVWNTTDDLDLFVDCPNGEIIYYNTPIRCEGQLDVDANRSDSNLTDQPVENIVWQNTVPPAGQYIVRVSLAKKRSNSGVQIPFSIRVKIDGREQVFNLAHPVNTKSITVYRFNFPS